MKCGLAMFLFSILMEYSFVLAQCQNFNLKFQNAFCDRPSDAIVKSTTCSDVVVKWQGNKNQTYQIEASGFNQLTGESIALQSTTPDCSFSNCTATIFVKESMLLKWTIRSICKSDGATFYSDTLRGETVVVPSCSEQTGTMHLFPNPTTGSITVDYLGNTSGKLQLLIYDIRGSVIFKKWESAEAGIYSQYHFNLKGIPPGIYLLQAQIGAEITQVKFVID